MALLLRLRAQSAFQGVEALFTEPRSWVVYHTTQHLRLNGKLLESDWRQAAWSTNFGDIGGAGKPQPTWQTRVKMLWNDSTSSIAVTLQEPHLWAAQTQHDDILFKDNDFEVFIDPDNNTHQDFEIEIPGVLGLFAVFAPPKYRFSIDLC